MDFAELRAALVAHLERYRRSLWARCVGLIAVEELIDDYLTSFRKNRHVLDGAGEIAHETYILQVNGDPQRGKSSVEALISCICFYLNATPRCKDRSCALLCTPMIAWAKNLHTSVERQSLLTNEDVALQEQQELNQMLGQEQQEELLKIPITFYAPRSGGDDLSTVVKALWAGGTLIFARTGPQIKKMAELLRADINHPIAERPVWPIMVKDESDRMLGKCSELSDPSHANVYERAMNDLLGLVVERGAGRGGAMPAQRVRPALVLAISATNALYFAWTMLRAGETRREGRTEAERGRPLFRVLDVITFKRDDHAVGYFGFDKFKKFGYREDEHGNQVSAGTFLTSPLVKQDWYVNEQLVQLYEEALRTPRAALLDCTTSGVQWHVVHMQGHVYEALRQVRERASRDRRDAMPHGAIVVVVHGSHVAFEGSMGLRFTDHGHVRLLLAELIRLGEAMRGVSEFGQAFVDAVASCRNRLEETLAAAVAGEDIEIEIEPFWPLLHALELEAEQRNPEGYKGVIKPARAASDGAPVGPPVGHGPSSGGRRPRGRPRGRPPPGRSGNGGGRMLPRRMLSNAHLNLVLYMLRKYNPLTPVIVAGFGMVRRCLSVIAVDIANPAETTPLLAVTHMVINSKANGSDLTQQFLRPSTTLVQFYTRWNFQYIYMLATEQSWAIAEAMVDYNRWDVFMPSQANPEDDEYRSADDRRLRLEHVQRDLLATTLALRRAEDALDVSNVRDYLPGWLQAEIDAKPEAVQQAFSSWLLEVGQQPHVSVATILNAMHVSRLLSPPEGIARLFTTHNPITSPGSGRQESMFFEYFASLDSILSGGPPVMRVRNAATGRAGSSVPSLLLGHIRRALWEANAVGAEDEPGPNANPLTGREIADAINAAYPELRAEFASQLGVGGSLGFYLQRMAEDHDPAIIARRPTIRPTGRGGRLPFEYWLIFRRGDEPPPLPQALRRYPRIDELNELARQRHDPFCMTEIGRDDEWASEVCPICYHALVEDDDEEEDPLATASSAAGAATAVGATAGGATAGAERRMWRVHPGRTAGEAAHVVCSDCWPRVLADREIDESLDRMHCPVCVSRSLPRMSHLINVWRDRCRQANAPETATAAVAGGVGGDGGSGVQGAASGGLGTAGGATGGALPELDSYAPQRLAQPTRITEETVVAARQHFQTVVRPTVTFSFILVPLTHAALGTLSPRVLALWRELINEITRDPIFIHCHRDVAPDYSPLPTGFDSLLRAVRLVLVILYGGSIDESIGGKIAEADARRIYDQVVRPDGYVLPEVQERIFFPDQSDCAQVYMHKVEPCFVAEWAYYHGCRNAGGPELAQPTTRQPPQPTYTSPGGGAGMAAPVAAANRMCAGVREVESAPPGYISHETATSTYERDAVKFFRRDRRDHFCYVLVPPNERAPRRQVDRAHYDARELREYVNANYLYGNAVR